MFHYMQPDPTKRGTRTLPNIETMQSLCALCPECKSLIVEPAAPSSGIRVLCQNCKFHEKRDVPVTLATWKWFYWYCLPGCLPDSEPMGPFADEAAALKDARSASEEGEEGQV